MDFTIEEVEELSGWIIRDIFPYRYGFELTWREQLAFRNCMIKTYYKLRDEPNPNTSLEGEAIGIFMMDYFDMLGFDRLESSKEFTEYCRNYVDKCRQERDLI